MKTLTTTILAFFIVLSFGAAKADGTNNGANNANANAQLTVDYAVNTYVDAITLGHTRELNNIFDSNLKYTVERGNKTMVFNKDEAFASFNEDSDMPQDCLVTSTVSTSTPDVTIVKIEQQYPNCTRTNFITMVNSAQGWKVKNIYSTFE